MQFTCLLHTECTSQNELSHLFAVVQLFDSVSEKGLQSPYHKAMSLYWKEGW